MGSNPTPTAKVPSSRADRNRWAVARKCVASVGDYLGLAYSPDGMASLGWTDLRAKLILWRCRIVRITIDR